MPDGLLTVDDEAPQKIPQRHFTGNANDSCQDGQYEDWGDGIKGKHKKTLENGWR
jgi:hypothetical protein